MSKTRSILSENPIIVTPSLACHIGLDAAVMVQKINFLCNTPNSGKLIKGEKWIHNTLEQWCAIFPFWSSSTIRRLLSDLEEKGILITCQPAGNNRTKFYRINNGVYEALTLEALDALPSDQIEQLELTKLSRCYKTEESTEESKGCLSAESHAGVCFTDRNPRPYPNTEEQMYELLEAADIPTDPEKDGNFYQQMDRANWRIRGKPVADWMKAYERRVEHTTTRHR